MKRCLNCMEEYSDRLDKCPLCHYDPQEEHDTGNALKAGAILQRRYIVGTCQRERSGDITYVGWDALFERKVLIQEFFPVDEISRVSGTDITFRDGTELLFKEKRKSFIQYFEKLVELYREKNVAEIYSCFIENEMAYVILQYSSCATLDTLLRESPQIAAEEAMNFVNQAINALRGVHGLGLCHGNVKLEHFWVTEKKEIILKDFEGYAHYDEDYLDNPENLEAAQRKDVYQLGIMTGRLLLMDPDITSRQIKELIKNNGHLVTRQITRTLIDTLELGHRRSRMLNEQMPIKNLDDFYRAIFMDGETVSRSSNKKKLKKQSSLMKKTAGIMTAVLACMLITASVVVCGGKSWNTGSKASATPSDAVYEESETPRKKDEGSLKDKN